MAKNIHGSNTPARSGICESGLEVTDDELTYTKREVGQNQARSRMAKLKPRGARGQTRPAKGAQTTLAPTLAVNHITDLATASEEHTDSDEDSRASVANRATESDWDSENDGPEPRTDGAVDDVYNYDYSYQDHRKPPLHTDPLTPKLLRVADVESAAPAHHTTAGKGEALSVAITAEEERRYGHDDELGWNSDDIWEAIRDVLAEIAESDEEEDTRDTVGCENPSVNATPQEEASGGTLVSDEPLTRWGKIKTNPAKLASARDSKRRWADKIKSDPAKLARTADARRRFAQKIKAARRSTEGAPIAGKKEHAAHAKDRRDDESQTRTNRRGPSKNFLALHGAVGR